nr:MAG TPA: hypothetical protein [Caudoviricetes sp.]DAY41084.1 MAG TPA: hypothetical protein [Caudoviricetes sp.]
MDFPIDAIGKILALSRDNRLAEDEARFFVLKNQRR